MENSYDGGKTNLGSALDHVEVFVLRHASLYSVTEIADEACYTIS
jgi:hypothetical protein